MVRNYGGFCPGKILQREGNFPAGLRSTGRMFCGMKVAEEEREWERKRVIKNPGRGEKGKPDLVCESRKIF